MRRSTWVLLAAGACVAEEPESSAPDPVVPLDRDFAARLTERYACGTDAYLAYDAAHTIALFTGSAEYGRPQPAAVAYDLSDAASPGFLIVQTGTCLSTPGCTDDPSTSCSQEVFEHFDGVRGTVSLAEGEDLAVAGDVTDLVLVRRDGERAFALDALALPAAPRWTEPTQ